ncbi:MULTISPECIES: DMT family transporter [unclassified Paenibacillus]|uniref:EamA family transporter n=1 Tax=unclassified Paenibacillus TaxID=185978 RepID=UPI001AEA34ED|nr:MULTISPECIES: DMT family transporter [unclassified Paenibacillus]MBP1156374.1 drug/metabolite transporter (DMT)-like permease [Paenibacillus sp. PvP091]MBP1168240.1 drug/metabolite transporter (DMT)-like permease [Paenibacillus sp. PvR098]MBP2439268.1 drug/metabolite transporter (DMT)-like permease [Paenibacillus sp. PvP052]
MQFSERFKASVLVLIGAASFGILSTFVKLAYDKGFTPAEVTGSQVIFGFAVMWMISLPLWHKIKQMSKRSMLKLIGSGAFTGLTGVFYYYSLQTLDASFAVLLLFQFTWMGLLMDWLLHGKVPGRYQLAGVAVILAGTVLASGLWMGTTKSMTVSGVGLGLLAAASYTLFIYFSGKVAVEVPALLRSSWMVTGATITVSFIYPPEFLWNGSLADGLWLWGGILALFGMILPPYLFAKGAPYLDTGMAAILGAVELPVVVLVSGLLLGESSGWVQWLGIGLIFAGIVVSERRSAAKGIKPGAN